jgi:flavin reductase (DIM6/NTAB) family NADH-FMN oxidoreductase RutF
VAAAHFAEEKAMFELDDVGLPNGKTDVPALRHVYGRFPTGVMAVCAMYEGDPVGFAVSSFNTVSVEPPLVSICVQQGSSTWPLLSPSPRVGLSVLALSQQALCRQLAARNHFDRFTGAAWSVTRNGAVLIDDAAAWLECDLHDVLPVGDHELVVLRVRQHRANPDVTPLVFHASQFHSLSVAG